MTTENIGRRYGPALEAAYVFNRWLIPAIEKFPRSQKFVLGDRILQHGLDVLETLVDATFNRKRDGLLDKANLGLEKLRFLVRLSYDMRYLDVKRYEHAARSIDEIGRLIGGWKKQHATATSNPPV